MLSLSIFTLKIDTSSTILDFEIEKVVKDQPMPLELATLPCQNVAIEKVEIRRFDSMIDALLSTKDEFNYQLLKQIVDALKKNTARGLLLTQLREELDMKYTDENIRYALRVLEEYSPPLVCRVGPISLRYVLVPYLDDWVIDTAGAASKAKSGGFSDHQVNDFVSERLERSQLVVPNLWTDVNGLLTPLLLSIFLRAVTDLVIKRPGITISSIQRQFNKTFTRKEVHEILEILVKRETLKERKITVERYQKPTVFSKTRTSRSTRDVSTINPFTQSCYWATSNYYNKLP
jgi:hypothetical protein